MHQLKFGNRQIISSHTLVGIWLLIHAGSKRPSNYSDIIYPYTAWNNVTTNHVCFMHIIQHTEVEIKWPPFCRWHFWMHYLQWKCLNHICSFCLNWHKVSTGSENGLAPNSQKATVSTNDGWIYWCIQASPSLNELNENIIAWMDVVARFIS